MIIFKSSADRCFSVANDLIDHLNAWYWPRRARRLYIIFFPVAVPLHLVAALACGGLLAVGTVLDALDSLVEFWSAP